MSRGARAQRADSRSPLAPSIVSIWDGHPQPPSRWDQYFEDKLLPDGTLRLRRVGRHIKHSPPDDRADDHALVFP